MTNKYAGTCKDCGGHVAVGKGEISKEFDNYKDEVVWVVRHSDKSICSTIKAEEVKAEAKSAAINMGINWIKNNGTKSEKVQDGEAVVYDGRRGYNQVGWLITRTGNTIYLTSRNNLDGQDFSETYVYSGTQGKIEDLLWNMQLI